MHANRSPGKWNCETDLVGARHRMLPLQPRRRRTNNHFNPPTAHRGSTPGVRGAGQHPPTHPGPAELVVRRPSVSTDDSRRNTRSCSLAEKPAAETLRSTAAPAGRAPEHATAPTCSWVGRQIEVASSVVGIVSPAMIPRHGVDFLSRCRRGLHPISLSTAVDRWVLRGVAYS